MSNLRDRPILRLACLLLPLSALLVSQGCTTTALWERTNPDERIWINAKDVTAEELEDQGVDFDYTYTRLGHGFLVEKSALRKFHDYNLRLLGTPVTVVIDTACVVAVIGIMALVNDPDGTVNLVDAIAD